MDRASGFRIGLDAAERYERHVSPIMAPFVAAALDAVEVRPGHRVLDVACGTGAVARSVAPMVSPAGSVIGLDLNPAMLAVARHAAGGVPTLRWVEGSALSLPFDAHRFDAVVCQQGLQFVPDLDLTVGEAARVLRDGGCLAATVWSPRSDSPFMDAQYRAVERVLGPEGMGPLHAAFGCSTDTLVTSYLAAGLRDVDARRVEATIELPDFATFLNGHLRALPWAATLDAALPHGVTTTADSMLAELAPFVDAHGAATLVFSVSLVVGRR